MCSPETFYRRRHLDLPDLPLLRIQGKRVELRSLYPLAMILTIPISLISSILWLAPITTQQPQFWPFELASIFMLIYSIAWLTYANKNRKRNRRKAPASRQKAKVPRFVLLRKMNPVKVDKWVRIIESGTPGDLSSARGKFSDANIEAGERGEKMTAEILRQSLVIPGARIFHGLTWGDNDADFDHVVIAGNYVAIIDTKNWSGASHKQDQDSQVVSTLTDGSIVTRAIKLPHAIASMQRIFPEKTVEGFILVHGEGIISEHSEAVVFMGEKQKIMTHIGNRVRGEKGKVIIDDLESLHALLPSTLAE